MCRHKRSFENIIWSMQTDTSNSTPDCEKHPQHHVLPGAEWYNVLIRAPVTSIRHFEQIPVLLKDFFRRLNPIEDQIIIYNFLTEMNKDEVNE